MTTIKDAFESELKIGDTVIYATKNGGYGTVYTVGNIVKFHPVNTDNYSPLDKVTVQATRNSAKFANKKAIVYAVNVVKYKE